MAASLAEVDVVGCLLRSGLVSGDLIFVLPEPDGRLLAPRPGDTHGFYCQDRRYRKCAAGGARRVVQEGSYSCGHSDYAPEMLGRRQSRVVPWPVCDFDANGLAVNDRTALAERFIT